MMELLPCPFCGNAADKDPLHVCYSEDEWRGPSWTVQCDHCTATMGYSDSEDEAIAAWNRRVHATALSALTAERDALREALDKAADALNRVAWGGDFSCFVDGEWNAVNGALDAARAALATGGK